MMPTLLLTWNVLFVVAFKRRCELRVAGSGFAFTSPFLDRRRQHSPSTRCESCGTRNKWICADDSQPVLLLRKTSLGKENNESLVPLNHRGNPISTRVKPFAKFAKVATRKVGQRIGSIFSTFGLLTSAAVALVTDKDHFRRLTPAVKSLRHFLTTSGIDSELKQSLNRRLFQNLIILARVQQQSMNGGERRRFTAYPSGIAPAIPSFEESLRYMKYATAVYGSEMIKAAEIDARGVYDGLLYPLSSKRISEHVGLPEECIVLASVDYSTGHDALRHFVAVDHLNRKIVLSIRGTFTLSEMVDDLAGFTRSFCGGEAHSEMANKAEMVWGVAGGIILDLLDRHDGYELIITGHSLGAGTAGLLHILCHENDRSLVKGRNVRCFAYSSPPVFSSLEAMPTAFLSATNFIHEDDIVPFLSIDSVRHLVACLRAVESVVSTLGFSERLRLLNGYSKPSQALLDAVERAQTERLPPKPGAPKLLIPAASTVWMRERHKSGKYSIRICDPNLMASLTPLIHSNMVLDHFPPRASYGCQILLSLLIDDHDVMCQFIFFNLTLAPSMNSESDEYSSSSHESQRFEKLFSPLAHHLFPDGVSRADLSEIWPHREDRTPVSSKDARSAIENLVDLANHCGLRTAEMTAVAFAACATLPSDQSTTVSTPLLDGTSTFFRSILRCLVPSKESKVPANVTQELLGAPCDSLGRRSVLRLLANAVRKGWMDIPSEKILSSLYGVIFSMMFNAETCSDAVRLLYFITRRIHVRLDRMKRMKRCFEASKDGKGKTPLAPMLLIIHLYAHFDPIRYEKHIPVSNNLKLATLHRKIILADVLNLNEKKQKRPKKRKKMNGNFGISTKGLLHDSIEGIESRTWSLDYGLSMRDASDLLTNKRLQCLVLVEGKSSNLEIIRLRSSLPFMMFEEWYYTTSAASKSNHHDRDTPSQRSLLEQGANAQEAFKRDIDGRSRLLDSFVSLVRYTGAFLPEMESFFVNEIFTSWDGTDAMGRIICYELLPFLSPKRFEVLQIQVLSHLERFLVYGGPRLHFLVIAGALTGLVRRWAKLDWSHFLTPTNKHVTKENDHHSMKHVTLRKLVQWTDRTIRKVFLLQNDANLLLGMASLQFFTAVAHLTGSHCPFLIAPSPALVYQLLVAPSTAVPVDGMCQLLVDYKGSFQQLKSLEEFRRDPRSVSGLESVAVFNSFIWDYCNVLWKCTLTWNDLGNDPVVSLLLSQLPHESRQSLQLHEEAATALSIFGGALFAGYVDRFLGTVMHGKHDTVSREPSTVLRHGSLKLKYFEFLREECGLHGLSLFLQTFVGSLAQRKTPSK